jgi:hypothetical protein
MTNVLIVAGMHRSGTSLTASWLAHSGLFVGDTLLANRVDNPMGHFEDESFLHLHEDILKANGLNYQMQPGEDPEILPAHRLRAKELIAQRADRPMWGWKDPRTTLFLPLWKELIPNMKVLVVYRHYALVAESMMRRERKSPRNRNAVSPRLHWILRVRFSFLNRSLLRRYLRVWQRYNQAALDFARAYPNDSLVIAIEQLPDLSQAIIYYSNTAWDFELAPVEANDVLHPDMLRPTIGWAARLIAQRLEPSCDLVLAQLRTEFGQSRSRLMSAHPGSSSDA